MAQIQVHPDRLVLKLSATEKTLALRRTDVVLDRSAITSAIVTEDPWVWIKGARAPGAHLPRTLAIGTWRSHSGKVFVLARSSKPAVVIDFAASPEATDEPGWVSEFDAFSRVIVSTDHAAELMRALKLDQTTNDETR